MPPLPAIRHPLLASLEAQLRLAPREATLRDIERIESLPADIEAQRDYPHDWIIFRITGFRPQDVSPGSMTGEQLLADLCALNENLCARAKLMLTECAAGSPLTLAQLRERWNISEPTVKRLRRTGLITRRVEHEGQSLSIAMLAVVESFEARNPQLLAPTKKTKRYEEALRARLVHRASAYMRKLGWSIFRCAQRLAETEGVSEEGVRQLLLRELATSPSQPDITPRRAAAMWRVHRLGVDITDLARISRRSAPAIRREINLARLTAFRALPIAPPSPIDTTLSAQALSHAHVTANLRTPWPLDLLELLADWRARSPVKPALERAQTTAFAALRQHAADTLASLNHLSPRASALDELETSLRHATLLQRELIRAQHRLLIETIDARVGHPVEQLSAWRVNLLLREAVAAAAEASLLFDPARGGRLAASVGLAADKAITRVVRNWLPAHASASRRAQALLGPGVPVPDLTRRLNPWQKFTDPDPRVAKGVLTGSLSDQHARLLITRFGLLGSAPRTRAQTARDLTLDEIRYAHAESAALRSAIAAALGAT